MTDKVDYELLLPDEFEERLRECPVAYLPLGTLEWHGPHCALGTDSILSRNIFRAAARRFGGIVMPPLWVGPDRITGSEQGASDLIGMDTSDTTAPPRRLPGSLYWIPKGVFLVLVELILSQAKRAGFTCVVADGHGPSRRAWAEMVDSWESQFRICLISANRDFPGGWPVMIDHAGLNETSLLMSVAPDLVDLERIATDGHERPHGVGGDDPRESSSALGDQLVETTVALIGAKLGELGYSAGPNQ